MDEDIFVSDFDGSIADTFTPSPNGIGVEVAYQIAIDRIFGRWGNTALEQVGGVQNRAPGELIRAMRKAMDTADELLLESAQTFAQTHNGDLARLVPPGKGAPLLWNDHDPTATLAELLVREKLHVFEEEIGPNWPKPCTGFVTFYERCLQQQREFVVLSTGHDRFISRTFNVWGFETPLMVTDDDLRGQEPYLHKPDGRLMEMALALVPGCNRAAMYFGDDLNKDGKLATASATPFGWFSTSQLPHAHDLPKGSICFSDWETVADSYL